MKMLTAVGLCLLASSIPVAGQAPQTQIHNKQLRLTIYLPNAQNGFYRGTRFDWSGTIGDLEYSGHHLYRPWFSSVDPAVKDVAFQEGKIVVGPNSAMTGPAEEFQQPIGYDTAKPGDTFLKIGVGLLRKANNDPYYFVNHYDLVDGGKWTVHKTAHSVTFEQVLGGPGDDYGYVYTKTIRLVGNSNQMVIEHHLKNTGKLPLETKLYDHNFFTVDGLGVGTADSITVPYDIHPTPPQYRRPSRPREGQPSQPRYSQRSQPRYTDFVRIDGNKAIYIADLTGEQHAVFGLQGFSNDVKDYDFTVANSAAPVEVHFTGDRPLVDASVWSIRSILAVEPFIEIQADPGKDFSWKYTYTYSTGNTSH